MLEIKTFTYLFFFSIAILFLVRKGAKKIGLVDLPTERKRHIGNIPIVGGVAIAVCYSLFLAWLPERLPHLHIHLLGIFILCLIGVCDDKKNLSVPFRLSAQIAVSILLIYSTDIKLVSLGNILGLGHINLHYLSYPLTVIAIVAAINAFNMIDGLDGLLGSVSGIIFSCLSLLFFYHNNFVFSSACISLITILIAYLLLNLGILGKRFRIFMGDSGSMTIGWIIIWFMLSSSQPPLSEIKPASVLWLIGLPLVDMVATVTRRIIRNKKAFTADRTHIHHLLLSLGYSKIVTLVIISLTSLFFCLGGLLLEMNNVKDSTSFYLFLMFFGLYYFTMIVLEKRIQHKSHKTEKASTTQNV